MSFQFPFPTLKNLSMIKIGHTLLEKETRPMLDLFRKYYQNENEKDFDEIFFYKKRLAQKLLPSTVQIPELRHELADVIDGMLRQISDVVTLHALQTPTKAEDVALIFDVHGRLDVAASWRCYFEGQLNNTESVEPVLDLLDNALRMQMWCEIGAIIAKIMSLVGLDPHSLPKPKLIRNDGGNEYVLVCHMGGLLFQSSSSNVVSQLREILGKHHVSISSNDICFYIPITMLWEGYVFMREFFITLDKKEKQSFIDQVIPRLHNCILKFSAEMVIDLDDVMLHHLMIKASEDLHPGSANFMREAMEKMVMFWPFTQFFMPMMELLTPFLHLRDYFGLLCVIPWKVPDQCSFGTLYSNILLRFCQAIPLYMKRELVVDYYILQLGSMESVCNNNSKLYDKIVKIMSVE